MNDEQLLSEARRMASLDAHMQHLGIEVVSVALGRAVLSLKVVEKHLNFNRTCHGGVIFSLADAAFGMCSCTHGVGGAGIAANITYQVAVQLGETLTATAVEVSRQRRFGVVQIEVRRDDGKLVSSFLGTSYISGKPIALPEA